MPAITTVLAADVSIAAAVLTVGGFLLLLAVPLLEWTRPRALDASLIAGLLAEVAALAAAGSSLGEGLSKVSFAMAAILLVWCGIVYRRFASLRRQDLHLARGRTPRPAERERAGV